MVGAEDIETLYNSVYVCLKFEHHCGLEMLALEFRSLEGSGADNSGADLPFLRNKLAPNCRYGKEKRRSGQPTGKGGHRKSRRQRVMLSSEVSDEHTPLCT